MTGREATRQMLRTERRRRGVPRFHAAVVAGSPTGFRWLSRHSPTTAAGPAAVSVTIRPTTARVGEFTTQTYRLSRALDRSVSIWLEVDPPDGSSYESGPIDFAAGATTQVFTSGYLQEIHVGDWAMRIKGERQPEDVELGEPSSVAWTVVP